MGLVLIGWVGPKVNGLDLMKWAYKFMRVHIKIEIRVKQLYKLNKKTKKN